MADTKSILEKIRKLKEENESLKKGNVSLVKFDNSEALESIKECLTTIVNDFKTELTKNQQIKSSIDTKNVEKELLMVQKVIVKKMNDLIKSQQFKGLSKFDLNKLETETTNVGKAIDKLGEFFKSTPQKESMRIAPEDIQALAKLMSNIFIPQPPPASPSFKNQSGTAVRASTIEVSGSGPDNKVAAVTVVNPDGTNVGGSGGGDASAANQTIQIAAEQAIQNALEIMDDWDESDRAKVNPIVGQTGVQGASGAVSNNTQRVVLATDVALPTGSNVIGQVTANAGTNLNTSALLTTAAHDAAFGTAGTADAQVRTIQGIASMTPVQVSQATAASLNMTEASASGILTSVQLIDDAVFTDDTSTHSTGSTKGVGIMAVADPTDAAVNANDVGMPAMNTNRALKTILQANSGVDIGDVDVTSAIITSGTITTVSTVTALGAGTTGPMKAEDAAHNTGDQGFPAWAVSNEGNTARAADNDYLPIASDTEGNIRNVGNRDHDAIDAGEPMKIGFKAVDLGATPAAVAAADRVDSVAMRNGIPFVLNGHPNILTQSLQITDADGAQTDTAIITVSSGTSIVVTKVSVVADNANTTDVSARIGFGTANTPGADAAQVIFFHPGIAAGSGVVEGNGSGIIGIGASNEDVRITCEDPVGGSINVIVTYFTVAIG